MAGRIQNLKPWPKGKSGNPGGRPRKRPITEMYESILANSENCEEIKTAVLKMLTSGGMAGVLALKEIADRLEGKVTKTVETEHTVTLAERFQRASERIGL